MRALSLLLAGLAASSPALATQDFPPVTVGSAVQYVVADELHTVSGEVLADRFVRIEDGRIAAIGDAAALPRLRQDTPVVRARVVTPGLVDVRTVVGLAGIYNASGQAHDQDQLERSKPIQPGLRAVDAYNAREDLVAYVRSYGVTTIHTGHGPGALISGQTMIAKTHMRTADKDVIVPTFGVAATLATSAQRGSGAPGTRGKAVSMLRAALIEAREYQDSWDRAEEDKEPKRDLNKDALVRVLKGEAPLIVTAHRAQDIASALRIGEEFGVRVWLDMAAEAYALVDEIRAAGVPVLLHPSMTRANGENENLSFTTAAKLAEADVPFAIQTGYEGYVPKARVLVFEAAIAAAYGLDRAKALEAITLTPARLLGMADRVGSIEVGKDADLALWDGDPFEYTTHCTGVVLEGTLVSNEAR